VEVYGLWERGQQMTTGPVGAHEGCSGGKQSATHPVNAGQEQSSPSGFDSRTVHQRRDIW